MGSVRGGGEEMGNSKRCPHACCFGPQVECTIKETKMTKQSSGLLFTSCLRDSIFSFLSQNHLIEQKIQKAFTHGVSGVLEHT